MILARAFRPALPLLVFCTLAGESLAQDVLTDSSRMAIHSLFEGEFVRAWQESDPVALSKLWVEDGDWSSIIGSRRIVSGRDQLQGVWQVGLQGRDSEKLRGLRVEVTNIRMLTHRFGLVDLVMHFAEESPSVIREAFVMVVQQVGMDWKIVSARAARIPN